MMKITARVALALSLIVTLSTPLRAADLPKSVASLVAAERAFAAMSVADGMRAAFLAYLADSALVFRPGPTPGRDVYEKRAAGPEVLSWAPAFAEVSASGDFGWTTGPWDYRKDRDTDPVAFGHFVSVWKKQSTGSWKVILDAGITHDAQPVRPELATRTSKSPGFPDPARSRRSLMQAERAFADAARGNLGAAYADFADDDVRLCRNGAAPTLGKTAVCRAAGESGLDAAVATSGAAVADSGDLGYTIGSVGDGPVSYFLRIWRREPDGEWRIVLDLDSPVPTE